MTDNELFKAAQDEFNHCAIGEHEQLITKNTIIIASIICIIICMFSFFLKLFYGKTDYFEIVILLVYSSSLNLIEGSKLKLYKKIIIGIIELILSTILFFMFIGAVCA